MSFSKPAELLGPCPWNAGLEFDLARFVLSVPAQRELGRYLATAPSLKELRRVKSIESLIPQRNDLPALRREVERLQTALALDPGLGFAVIQPFPLPFEQQIAAPWILSKLIGETLAQNHAGDHMYLVFDKGRTMDEGARYSEGKEGGSIHTDGVNLASRFDYFLLSCIERAEEGGETILVSGGAVYRHLARNAPEALEELRQKFVWEYKGINAGHFYHAPILKQKSGECPTWRYLRNYVEEAARLQNEAISSSARAAMDRLDEGLEDSRLQFRYTLQPGETLIVDDQGVFHGRTPFVDVSGAVALDEYLGDPRRTTTLKRTYSRIWVKRRSASA